MPDELTEVYGRHVASVWRFVRARVPTDADAEDVTGEVFMQAVRSWHRFDPGQGSEGAWLQGIARHAAADWWRRRRDVPTDQLGTADRDDPGLEEAVLDRLAGEDLRSMLHLLTEKERRAVALRFGSGLRAAEVGAALGVSETAARMLVYRAVTKLREVVTRD
ncbi:MAG: RNA polymerase sigma factor [Acidimicrobiales bacterium]